MQIDNRYFESVMSHKQDETTEPNAMHRMHVTLRTVLDRRGRRAYGEAAKYQLCSCDLREVKLCELGRGPRHKAQSLARGDESSACTSTKQTRGLAHSCTHTRK